MIQPTSLAILHYHLQPGGVTQVIRNHLLAWNAVWRRDLPLRVVVLHGGRADGWDAALDERLPRIELKLAGVPELEYDDLRPGAAGDAARLADATAQKLDDLGFRPDATLLHWHNHSVGKNAAAPGTIELLAKRGWRQLVQIHDFAEDARPGNYAHLRSALRTPAGEPLALYPLANTIRYATLTGRDRRFLIAAGMPQDAVFLLPNPVHATGERPDAQNARAAVLKKIGRPGLRRWGLYPVRGIRRKNLGELLLWACYAPRDVAYGVTLRPETPVEARSYDAWKRLAEELDLNLAFDVGALPGIDFATNVAAADGLFTTSVAEGFGMAFLETALAGKPLLGRDLPEITADFRERRLSFPGLAPAIRTPLDWIGESGVAELRRVYREQVATYDLNDAFDEAWSNSEARLREANAIDFGALLPGQQAEILRKLARDPGAREAFDRSDPEWAALRRAWEEGTGGAAATPTGEALRGLETYSVESLGETLLAAAQSLFDAPSFAGFRESADSRALIREFLAPERFRPLRFVEFDGG